MLPGVSRMRVLLISTNRCDLTVPPFPLGLSYVAAAIDERCHDVEVWDAMFEEDWASSLRRRIGTFDPDVIGLSVRNVDDQDIRSPRFLMEDARDMAAVCRAETQATLVAGGPAVSMFPAEALSYLGVDYGIVGEGESALPLLLDALVGRGSLHSVPGLVRREDGQVRQTAPELIPELDQLPPADRRRFDSARYYAARGTASIPNAATVQTKRGCSLSCVYCSTPALEGRELRLRSPGRVIDEVEALAKQGQTRVHFVDSVFTNPEEHAGAICEELIRRRLEVRWSCTLNPAFCSAGLARLMKRAGCVLVMVGNESGCDRQLAALRKGFTRRDVERCFEALEGEGVPYHAFLLLGGPGEDRESIDESVDLMRSWAPSQVSVTVGIRLYPGCDLTRIAEGEGQLPAGAHLLTPRFYLAPSIRDWIFDYLAPVVAGNPAWVL